MIATLLIVGFLAPLPQDSEQSTLSRAQELAPGQLRAEVLTEALDSVGESELQGCLEIAYDEFLNQVRAFRLDLALPLAEGMFRRSEAPWSAISLALASTRAGRFERSREVLVEQLRRTPDGPLRPDLLERLGLVALGSGETQEARKHLGAAFARGSANAGVVLGRMALAEGDRDEARVVFRSLLGEEPSQSWAHRGWGLSMLP